MLIKTYYFSTQNWIQSRNSCANLVLFHEVWNKFEIPGWRLLGLFGSGKFRIKIGSDNAWTWLLTALKRRPWTIFDLQIKKQSAETNLKKIWAVERNFVFDAIGIFDFKVSVFEGVNHYAMAITGRNISQICDYCMTIR